MKRKIVSLLLATAMATTAFTGCGKVTETDYVTEASEPKSVNGYFEENNLTVEGAGVTDENTLKKFTYLTTALNSSGQEVEENYDGAIGIIEKIDGDKKVITAKVEGDGATACGFVDRYTGICYIDKKELTPKTSIKVGEKEYEISLDCNPEVGTITVTCPSDYDGAAFFICGANEELLEEIDKKTDKFVSISEINHGDYDMKFFAY